MTGQEIKTMTEGICDIEGEIDDTLFLNLLNSAKDLVEDERPWVFLIKEDTNQTASAGDTYLTMKTLPSDLRYDYELFLGANMYSYTPILFEQRGMYKDAGWYYYIDYKNSQFALCGSNTGGTIHLFYICATPDITLTTSPTWPDRFHRLLAYMVAGYYMMGVDADDIYARMSPENKMMAQNIKQSMVTWNTNLRLRAQEGMVLNASNFPPSSAEIALM